MTIATIGLAMNTMSSNARPKDRRAVTCQRTTVKNTLKKNP
ncbi:hypothetical protein [Mesorhizobium sp. M4B.F.Ca.ET.089.01.1.1]|nr:hypothetical protein [Mesorhizobium sp. M4B.F.Ca.ET.089.01.1.1]